MLCGWWREPPGLPARQQLEYHPGIGDTGGVSRDTGSVSEILWRYRGRCSSSLARLQTGRRAAETRGIPRAQHPSTTPTIYDDHADMTAARCSTLRALSALRTPRVLRVLRNAEQQYAVKWWWREPPGSAGRPESAGESAVLRENAPFSGRMRRSPGESAVLRENGPFSGRAGLAGGARRVTAPSERPSGGGGAGHAAGGALSAAPAPLSAVRRRLRRGGASF